MGLFWDYFKKTLRFPLIWKPGPLGILAEGGAGALDQARDDALWLRDQFLPTRAETVYLNDFARSRGLVRFPEEEDDSWYTRVKFAYIYWKSGGKVSGLEQFMEKLGFDITITEDTAPEWAHFSVSAEISEGAARISLLFKLINEMKPARSKLKPLEVITESNVDTLGCGAAIISHIQNTAKTDQRQSYMQINTMGAGAIGVSHIQS